MDLRAEIVINTPAAAAYVVVGERFGQIAECFVTSPGSGDTQRQVPVSRREHNVRQYLADDAGQALDEGFE